MEGKRRGLRSLGYLVISAGLLGFVVLSGGLYVLDHNAYYTCADLRPPAGALPFEAAYAGHDSTALPMPGVECVWNAENGSTFTTFVPDYALAWLFGLVVISVVAAVALFAISHLRTR